MSAPVAVIVGVGPGNGMAFANRFAKEGYRVALLSRDASQMDAYASQIDGARGYPGDVTDTGQIDASFAKIQSDLGPVETVVYNAGSGAWGNVDELTPEDLAANMDVNATGLMRVAKAVLPQMRGKGHGNLIVIGAGAALRGRPGTIAFAAGKAAQRSVAQSLARQLGPERIHVAYVVIDGAIDLERTRARMPDAGSDDFLKPEAIADAVWGLTRQHPSAWSFEIDLRPFKENW
ncbi:SDR family NAD(P)-dependent oxidoreductase [Oceanibium sediminis]|uniref:SDR family NAD(P)-dependent oxidoreductase n=1 Tax=Oceanibium sediminis TaxID=2026339 RepID=UPI000DD38542|nr:SDR family NAD(P)-dependent oxidoreductase [Oceanibium sediminis]